MTVDGVLSVRTCSTLVQQGMHVDYQNAWPSVKWDAIGILDKMDKLMPVGFYYKAFYKPKFVWHIVEPIIRRVAGLGKLDTNREFPHYEQYHAHTDITVIGGGIAGLSAASAAAKMGVDVTLIEDQVYLGGHLRTSSTVRNDITGFENKRSYEIAIEMSDMLTKYSNVNILNQATAFGLYHDNLLGVTQNNHIIKLRSKKVIAATGSNEIPFVFEGNDLPGVMLSRGVLRLINLYGVKPGNKALIITNNSNGFEIAKEMVNAEIDVLAIADSRPSNNETQETIDYFGSIGIPILQSYQISKAVGPKKVKKVILIDKNTNKSIIYHCDIVCLSAGFDPFASLLSQTDTKFLYDESFGESVPSQLPNDIYAVGEVTGYHNDNISILQGKIAGLEASTSLVNSKKTVLITKDISNLQKELDTLQSSYKHSINVSTDLISIQSSKKKFVCFCEDVTERDLKIAVEEGFDNMQTLKRYSTLSMGPCQGKTCLKNGVRICATETNKTIDETGSTTSRPPVFPVSMGALAGPGHIPIKLTPLDKTHKDLGAKMMDVGPWKRPFSYGDPQDECLAVRNSVGIIDVSTLGKLDVRGSDAPALLDFVYTHNFSSLKIGRIRYGILCSDNGMIIDDGTVTRLSNDRYFITTTTGNIDLMEEWLKWWSVGTYQDIYISNVTAAYGAINVAGPKARQTLMKLTDIDLSPDEFRYMRTAEGMVAGVPSILLRIGFVGEVGWEVHFPAEFAKYMWDTVLDAGKEFGIKPFGVEAQRILRLEKKHIIIGQDTDIVSNPLEADLAWAVRFDKEVDFIGKHALTKIKENGLKNKLVGFVMESHQIPEDGVPILKKGAPIGRVTSARLSPTSGKVFGLAWVPIEEASEESTIYVQINDKPVAAKVTHSPMYDPEGKRLRS